MAILSKKEFATACGQTTNWLSVYIRRKKIELNAKEEVDTSVKINKDFLLKWGGKKVQAAPPSPVIKKPGRKAVLKVDDSPDSEELSEKSSDDQLTRAKKFRELKHKEIAIRLLELDEAKKRGELMPTDSVKSIFVTHARSSVTSFKDAGDLLLIKIVQKYQVSLEDQALFKTELINVTNRAVDASIRISFMELDKVIEEFSQTREVGEHS